MAEIQEMQLQIRCNQESEGVQEIVTSNEAFPTKLRPSNRIRQYYLVMFCAFFSLIRQGLLLGRLYYDKGGKIKWLATFVQSAGFPILFISRVYSPLTTITSKNSSSVFALILLYLTLGLLMAGDNMMYSYGLLYLPFNAVFSFFLNFQKVTPSILNSLVLLTILASLLAADTNSSGTTQVSKGKYVIGFLCTLAASAGYSLVIKRQTITGVLEMQIFPSLVATYGDWKELKREMNEYTEGKVSYVMTLVWTAITWQISSVGTVGLIFEASSLFSNVAGTLGLPIVPIFAVIFFHDKLSGIKVGTIFLLSLWGFVSYIYQYYMDNNYSKETRTGDNQNEEKL
ncbi:hypothetical protein MKX01_018230 [Papaver californicum]|nr:hypothetical protein MKX01_018230 [Papaver californicum]